MKVFSSAFAVQSAAASRVYSRHAGYNCYDGFGGRPLEKNDAVVANQSTLGCQTLCDGNISCVAFTRDVRQEVGDCWLRTAYELDECNRSSDAWDTYTLNIDNVSVFLQQQVDAVHAHYKPAYPDLAISLAWIDGTHDVTAVAGSVSGHAVSPDDTFLYGSGTKPFTATGVLRLIDSGRVRSDDKAYVYIDPYLKAHGRPSLEEYFGEGIKNTTVLQLIRMGGGIRDFEDDYSYDVWVLGNGSKVWEPYAAMNFSVSDVNIKAGGGEGPLICNPGECTAYSSTSYIVAGLLLASVLTPESDWFDFDLGDAIFTEDQRKEYPSMHFAPDGNADAAIRNFLTVPGHVVADTWPKTTIYEQNPSILGWTCGNMVASPRDVAKFFWHLLNAKVADSDAEPLLSDVTRTEMTLTKTLSKGWSAGDLKYGAGLMDLIYAGSYNSKWKGEEVFVKGHEGDTYGFVSSQGFVPDLGGAYSLVTNIDNEGPMWKVACILMQSMLQVKQGFNHSLECQLTRHHKFQELNLVI